MKPQSLTLLNEWNAKAVSMLNASYVLDSSRATQLVEIFDGQTFSRIHRLNSGVLILEEREKGAMYARAWEIKQEFTELEEEFQKRTQLKNSQK